MDIWKYPLHELFHFVAGVIPGFTALLIFQAAHPGIFHWFFSPNFIGYRTMLTIVLVVAFVVGNTITTCVAGIIGAVGGIVGYSVALKAPYKPAHLYKIAPWRDRRWRVALKKFLGTEAPRDSELMSQELFDLRQRIFSEYRDQQQAATELLALQQEKFNSEVDDSRWQQWYEHFHKVVLSEPPAHQLAFHVQTGLSFNLEATGLYLLVSAIVVPAVRHWWFIIPAFVWLLYGFAEVYDNLRKYIDKWSTLPAQINYLSQVAPEGGDRL